MASRCVLFLRFIKWKCVGGNEHRFICLKPHKINIQHHLRMQQNWIFMTPILTFDMAIYPLRSNAIVNVVVFIFKLFFCIFLVFFLFACLNQELSLTDVSYCSTALSRLKGQVIPQGWSRRSQSIFSAPNIMRVRFFWVIFYFIIYYKFSSIVASQSRIEPLWMPMSLKSNAVRSVLICFLSNSRTPKAASLNDRIDNFE